jgi:DtxR family transcriptional regulator, Mn-dependent transcriptional regulator
MSDLIDTTEMYLRTVFELEEEGTPPLRARIAERLEQSGPTVSQTVSRMERDGLLAVGDDRWIRLSPVGRAMAARVMRKHRLAECMLVQMLDLEWDLVHAEACRWEHVISEDVERRLLEILDHPTVSPFGNPIPALAELDPDFDIQPTGGVPGAQLMSLREAADESVTHVAVCRIEETAQEDQRVLAAFHRAGVHVGAVVKCRRTGDRIMVGSGGEYTEVSPDMAHHVMVQPTRPPQTDDPPVASLKARH